MEKAAKYAGRLRRRASAWVPASWRSSREALRTVEGRRVRSPAVMEVDPGKPSSSWVAWEVSRVRRDPGSEDLWGIDDIVPGTESRESGS